MVYGYCGKKNQQKKMKKFQNELSFYLETHNFYRSLTRLRPLTTKRKDDRITIKQMLEQDFVVKEVPKKGSFTTITSIIEWRRMIHNALVQLEEIEKGFNK